MPWESELHRTRYRQWSARRSGETGTEHLLRLLDMTLRLLEGNGWHLRRELALVFRRDGQIVARSAVVELRNRLLILLDPRAEEWLDRAEHELAPGSGLPAPGAGSPALEETPTAPLPTGPLPDPLDIPPTVPGTEPGEFC